jgi:hypothetical protein
LLLPVYFCTAAKQEAWSTTSQVTVGDYKPSTGHYHKTGSGNTSSYNKRKDAFSE